MFVFGILVFIHELGHFATAKFFGVRVEEFGLGIPPRIWGIQKGETLYSINAIPLGGFVRLLGEDGNVEENVDEDGKVLSRKFDVSPHNFANKPAWQRAIILSAGVAMNILLAWVLFAGLHYFGYFSKFPTEVRLDTVVEESVFGEAGLQSGDIITQVKTDKPGLPELPLHNLSIMMQYPDETYTIDYLRNGEEHEVVLRDLETQDVLLAGRLLPESPAAVAGIEAGDFIKRVEQVTIPEVATDIPVASLGEHVEQGREDSIFILHVQREEYPFTVALSPKPDETGKQLLGLSYFVMPVFGTDLTQEVPFVGIKTSTPLYNHPQPSVVGSVIAGLEQCVTTVGDTFAMLQFLGKSLVRLVIPEGVAGPIGIASLVGQAVEHGIDYTIYLMALISINLAVMNILPIPALDGGRLLVIALEVISRRKLPAQWEMAVHSTGFVLLLLFIAIISLRDIQNFF